MKNWKTICESYNATSIANLLTVFGIFFTSLYFPYSNSNIEKLKLVQLFYKHAYATTNLLWNFYYENGIAKNTVDLTEIWNAFLTVYFFKYLVKLTRDTEWRRRNHIYLFLEQNVRLYYYKACRNFRI